MRFIAKIGDREFGIGLPEDGRRRQITLDGAELTVEWTPAGHDAAARRYGLLVGTRSYGITVRPLPADDDTSADGRAFEVHIGGVPYLVSVQDERARALASLAGGAHISGDAALRAPMPGLVSNVLAAEGEAVRRGQAIVVLEAMKMENDLPAPRAGIVKAVKVAPGQTVNQGDVLAVIGDPAGTAPEDADDSEE